MITHPVILSVIVILSAAKDLTHGKTSYLRMEVYFILIYKSIYSCWFQIRRDVHISVPMVYHNIFTMKLLDQKVVQIFFIIGICSLALISCRSGTVHNKSLQNKDEKELPLQPPAAVTVNRSKVLAKILEINVHGTNDFSINATIIEAQASPGYASMATAGSVCTLLPNYYMDEKHEVADNPRNRGLLALKDLHAGDTFNAEVFYDQEKGWFIQEVLK